VSSRALYRVALFGTDVSENVLYLSSVVLRLIGLHSCITVETPLPSHEELGPLGCLRRSQLYQHVNIRTPEDGDSTFSKTSVRNSATRYRVPEDIYKSMEQFTDFHDVYEHQSTMGYPISELFYFSDIRHR
jgi:hypothetical protein